MNEDENKNRVDEQEETSETNEEKEKNADETEEEAEEKLEKEDTAEETEPEEDKKMGREGRRARVTVLKSAAIEQGGARFAFDYETLAVKERVPLDYCHNDEQIVGFCENFSVSAENSSVECDAVLLADGSNGLADKIAFNLDAGVPYEASAFVDLARATQENIDAGDSAIVNGAEVEGPLTVYYNAELRGVAVCPHGADPETAFVALSGKPVRTIDKRGTEYLDDFGGVYMNVKTKNTDSAKNPRLELEAFVDEFGKELGVDYYLAGKTIEQARADASAEETLARTRKELEQLSRKLSEKIDALEKKVDAVMLTHRRGDEFGVSESREPQNQNGTRLVSALHRAAVKYGEQGTVRL